MCEFKLLRRGNWRNPPACILPCTPYSVALSLVSSERNQTRAQAIPGVVAGEAFMPKADANVRVQIPESPSPSPPPPGRPVLSKSSTSSAGPTHMLRTMSEPATPGNMKDGHFYLLALADLQKWGATEQQMKARQKRCGCQ